MTNKALPRAATTIAMALAAGMLTACGEEEVDLPEPAPPPTSVAAPATPDLDLTAEEREAVETAQEIFETFVANYQQILIDGERAESTDFGRLGPFGGLLAIGTWTEVDDNFQNGRRAQGALSWSLVDVEVDLDNVLASSGEHMPVVRLRYCLDATDWRFVDTESGQLTEPSTERVLAEPGLRHLATIEFFYFDPIPDGENPEWWLEKWENEEDQQC